MDKVRLGWRKLVPTEFDGALYSNAYQDTITLMFTFVPSWYAYICTVKFQIFKLNCNFKK